jgi:toxin YoeB
VSCALHFTQQAQKDAKKIAAAGLKPQTMKLLTLLKRNPFARYPPYEKLIGDLTGAYSRRISLHHRLVYQVIEEQKAVKILRMWTHYGK